MKMIDLIFAYIYTLLDCLFCIVISLPLNILCETADWFFKSGVLLWETITNTTGDKEEEKEKETKNKIGFKLKNDVNN